MLVVTIWVMMNLNNNVAKHGKKIIIIFVLKDLKGEIKVDTVFVMKAKLFIQIVRLKQNILINRNVVFN